MTSQNYFSIVRGIYQVLLSKGRTYASFTSRDKAIVEAEFHGIEQILDPMSGYGAITRFCAGTGKRSYALEYNLPQHYWQLLNVPDSIDHYLNLIDEILSVQQRYPRTTIRSITSDEWFPEPSKDLIRQLWTLTNEYSKTYFGNVDPDKYSLALLLPYLRRFSCSVLGDNVTHIKKGGICVYRNWEHDFIEYLKILKLHLSAQKAKIKEYSHQVLWGDARTHVFPGHTFEAMYTSPPYPNHRDFSSMFKPEHALLDFLGIEKQDGHYADIIGTNFVRGKTKRLPRSQAALAFVDKIHTHDKRKKKQISDDNSYYIPYLNNYFYDLEIAYANVERSFADNFKGFLVVVNNTHRGFVIPVSDVIIEIWRHLGYEAEIFAKNESSHMGAKNPRSVGIRAMHTEYIIKVWK